MESERDGKMLEKTEGSKGLTEDRQNIEWTHATEVF